MRVGPTVRWLVVGGYVVVIYATIPVAPRLWLALSHLTGVELEPLARTILLVTGVVVSMPAIVRPRWQTTAALTVLATAYVAVYRLQFEAPAERLHLIEYGLLPPLVAWALGPARALGWRLAAGALGGAVIGLIDEAIQGMTPGRIAQVSDVFMNATSVTLGALASWVLAIGPPPSRGSDPADRS